jgi:hypothetical protein
MGGQLTVRATEPGVKRGRQSDVSRTVQKVRRVTPALARGHALSRRFGVGASDEERRSIRRNARTRRGVAREANLDPVDMFHACSLRMRRRLGDDERPNTLRIWGQPLTRGSSIRRCSTGRLRSRKRTDRSSLRKRRRGEDHLLRFVSVGRVVLQKSVRGVRPRVITANTVDDRRASLSDFAGSLAGFIPANRRRERSEMFFISHS